jgi:hypothetical protein
MPTLQEPKQRRSLNESIGRLDELIDGLETAIEDVIREAIERTLRNVLTEMNLIDPHEGL